MQNDLRAKFEAEFGMTSDLGFTWRGVQWGYAQAEKEPVAYVVLFDAKLGGANVTDKLLIWRKEEATRQVREELIQDVVPLYLAPPLPAVPAGWVSTEIVPKDGRYLVCADTDDGPYVCEMQYMNDRWQHEGQPTYCHSYWISPTHWMPLPVAPTPQEPKA